MSDNKVTYSFVKEDDGTMVFRSKVNSFNLDHVTDKNLLSFYKSFSDYAALDTGLLPVDGSGLLAIRSAGNHTQVTYQHKPGLYYVNWGAFEGDRSAVSYLVAQPYRIVIIDFVDNNLLGARTFYSPIPATHPGIPLYHVNLPNINCRGYRGNGVGWICLYHNQDWSKLPFNERLTRAIERCSGIETYNDANMSETDGPRFYNMNNKPDYLSNPKLWQDKSSREGFEWTLDENLWIPILVKDRDNQDKHYNDGIPLTLADAIVGKYNAYYYDDYHPKPINALTNPNLSLKESTVADWFKRAYNSSATSYVGVDVMSASSSVREKIASTPLPPSIISSDDENEDEEDTILCDHCGENCTNENFIQDDNYWCLGCFEEYYVFCENTEQYLHVDSDYLYYSEYRSNYFDVSNAFNTATCDNCQELHWVNSYDHKTKFNSNIHWTPNIWHFPNGEDESCCVFCIDDFNDLTTSVCQCGVKVPVDLAVQDLTTEYSDIICNECASINYQKTMDIDGTMRFTCTYAILPQPVVYTVSESSFPTAYISITDYMKAHDMPIHDIYTLSLDRVHSSLLNPSGSLNPDYLSSFESILNDKFMFPIFLQQGNAALYPVVNSFENLF